MAKVLNAVFGIGIAVVVYIVVLLGIQAFYPTIEYEDYCNETSYEEIRSPMSFYNCDDNLTVQECKELVENSAFYKDNKENEECWETFNNAEEEYNKNFFIISSIIGVLIITLSYFLLSITNISVGIVCSGIILILWGFMRGWESTNHMTKFAVSLVIAFVVIFLSLKVNKKLNK